jgi:hypothetical protein
MIFHDNQRYVAYKTDRLCLSLDKQKGNIAFLGVESGGRITDRVTTDNELKPGYGVTFGGITKQAISVDYSEEYTRFVSGDTEVQCDFDCENDSFSIDIKNPEDVAMEFFFDISVGMPSIWAERNIPDIKDRKKVYTDNELKYSQATYSFPLIISFPDHGRIKIELVEGTADCKEELIMSESQVGLSLGYQNFSHHAKMNALHHGYSHLAIKNRNSSNVLKFKISVMDEVYPSLPFDNSDSAVWDGIRRCWLNTFTLDRNSYTMGDNIALGGIAHICMHLKSDCLQSIAGMEEQGEMIRAVLERAIDLTFQHGQASDGELSWESIDGAKNSKQPICSFIDTTPSSLIALAGVDNWKDGFAKPYLAQAEKACNFLISFDKDNDGIIEVPCPGTSFEDNENLPYVRPRNWWDNFAFGHKDIFFNILSHRAIRHTVELAEKYGETQIAANLKPFLLKFEKNFYKTFYNPSTGIMAGWIDCNNKIHDYMFTFATSMSINEGLVDKRSGKKMLQILLDKMDEQGFGDFRYGIPANAIPVAPADTFDWGVLTDWKRYENGAACGISTYPFLTALYLTGMESKGDDILEAMLKAAEKGPTFTGLMPGYGVSNDWRTPEGNPTGFNYLADQYYYLLAAYTGKARMKHPAVVDK